MPKHHRKNNRHFRVKGVQREVPDEKRMARALLGLARSLTPENVAKIQADAKERNYREAIEAVTNKQRKL